MLDPQYLRLAQKHLTQFANRDNFLIAMETAFGTKLEPSRVNLLARQWQRGDFRSLPKIQVLDQGGLGTAWGAYEAKQNIIYLDAAFLATASSEQIVSVLLEEIGHAVDDFLNGRDAIGDEGALFSELAQGHTLSDAEILSLRAEDDHTSIFLEGQQIFIEQANIVGTPFADTLNGTAAADLIQGLDRNDIIYGLGGNDTLIGGANDDTLYGGTGNDVFVFDSSIDSGIGFFKFNNDLVADFVRGQDKVDVSRIGISDFDTILALSTQATNTTIRFNYNLSFFSFALRNISTVVYSDFIFAALSDDNKIGTIFDDDLFGGLGNDTLNGDDGNDRLFGEQGNDTLIGGDGNDTLIGGSGNDKFVIEYANSSIWAGLGKFRDVVNDFVHGQDKVDLRTINISDFNTITAIISNDDSSNAVVTTYYDQFASFSSRYEFVLNGIDAGTLTATDFIFSSAVINDNKTGTQRSDDLFGGWGNDTLRGGDNRDRLFGEQGNDVLYGDADSDSLYGGIGNDIYYVGLGDTIIEDSTLTTEIDRVYSVISYSLGNNLEDLTLTGLIDINGFGNELNNVITGNSASNFLDGGLGADRLIGGMGNDLYLVDNIRDTIVETSAIATEIDFVYSNVSYSLSNNVEGLILEGASDINGYGNSLSNYIGGNAAKNIINGGAGADRMEGGTGNDVYYIDNVGDIVSETSTLSTEIEYVYSAVSYTLGSNIENLILTGAIAITATGNSLNNTVYGNSANNIINGNEGSDVLRDNIGNDRVIGGSGNDNIYAGAGNDTLTGGVGDDIYYLSYQVTDITNDTIIEDANSGIDTAYAIFTVGTLANNVEKLVLLGASAINATGNSLNNTITGNSAANILNGGAGNDTLTGGAGVDTFVLNKTSVDTITDFATTEKLQISASAFGGLTTAPLLTTQLRIGAGAISAATASQRFIFNTTDKSLYFDIDGLNGAAAVKIATISGLSTLNTTNFSLV